MCKTPTFEVPMTRIDVELIKPLLDFYTVEEVAEWLDTPQKLLDGEAPRTLIADGREDEVARLIDQLANGAHL